MVFKIHFMNLFIYRGLIIFCEDFVSIKVVGNLYNNDSIFPP